MEVPMPVIGLPMSNPSLTLLALIAEKIKTCNTLSNVHSFATIQKPYSSYPAIIGQKDPIDTILP